MSSFLPAAGNRQNLQTETQRRSIREWAREGERKRTRSVERKKRQTHRPLSHTSSVTERERNKQVCCAAFPLPRPLLLLLSVGGAWLMKDSYMQPVAFTLTEQENLSAALISFSPTATFPPPSPPPRFFFLHPLLLLAAGSKRSQNDAGGVDHGGVWCSCSRPTGGGGHLGLLGCPFQTSSNSQTGGRSVLGSFGLTSSLSFCLFCSPFDRRHSQIFPMTFIYFSF